MLKSRASSLLALGGIPIILAAAVFLGLLEVLFLIQQRARKRHEEVFIEQR